MPRFFEQTENNNPSLLQRLGFGRAGNITENMSFANFLTWLNNNLTFPAATFNTEIIDIGDWDMDTDTGVSVAHGLVDFKKIRRISVVIRPDADSAIIGLESANITDAKPRGAITSTDATDVNLFRETGGGFDNALFSATSFNRGWIVIDYIS